MGKLLLVFDDAMALVMADATCGFNGRREKAPRLARVSVAPLQRHRHDGAYAKRF
jgi:hypothetical protein